MTEEPASTESNAAQRRSWRVGPLTVMTVGIFLLVNVLYAVWHRAGSYSDVKEAILIGLCFGQVGSVAVWVFSIKIRRRLRMTVATLASAVLASLYFNFSEEASPKLSESAAFALLFVAYALIVMAGLFATGWVKHLRSVRSESIDSAWTPKFTVRHLLVLMVAIALFGTVIRMALPEMASFAEFSTIAIVSLWACMAIAAGVFLLDKFPSLWRLGVFAAFGLVTAYFGSWLVDWPTSRNATVVQMAVLALAICVPQLDRYVMRIEIEPREEGE